MKDINRISFPSIPLVHHNIHDAFKIIRDAGYKNVDIIDKPPHYSCFEDECNLEDMRAAAQKYGLKISMVNGYFGGGAGARIQAWTHHPGLFITNRERFTEKGFASDDPKDIEKELHQSYKAIDDCVFLGADMLRFMPGDDDVNKLDRIVVPLKEMAIYAKEKGITLVCENHDDGICGDPKVLVKMIDKVGMDNVGVIYEPLNLMNENVTDYKLAFEIMRDIIKMVHLKDAFLNTTTVSYTATLFGEGEFDYAWVLKRLEDIGYSGNIGLEYEVEGYPVEKGAKQYLDGYKKLAGIA